MAEGSSSAAGSSSSAPVKPSGKLLPLFLYFSLSLSTDPKVVPARSLLDDPKVITVSNMKQENNKVTKELQAGLDHVRGLQVEIGRTVLKLRDNIELSIGRSNRAQKNFISLSVKGGVPLRTFLFGSKPKKASLFSCMPAMPKPVSDMRPGHFR